MCTAAGCLVCPPPLPDVCTCVAFHSVPPRNWTTQPCGHCFQLLPHRFVARAGRICLNTAESPDDPLVEPCSCHGTLAHAHMKCLEKWVNQKRSTKCELCKAEYRQPVLSVMQAALSKAGSRRVEAGSGLGVRQIQYNDSCYGRFCSMIAPCAPWPQYGLSRRQQRHRWIIMAAVILALIAMVLYYRSTLDPPNTSRANSEYA